MISLGVVCMFLNGFVMLTPHRIAMLCANHVIKRFHFPQCTVPLFIYKIHTPMELSSLISTFLANVVAWITDAVKAEDDNKMKFKRIISCIAIWIMFLATVISYFIFISGEEYGNFESFYWSVVSITFANGFSSNFGFAVNFNATMYGAGMPTSSFVTFIVHKSYNYFYNKYFWNDYDYKLVVVQYAFTSFFLALTGALWTWNEVKQLGGGGSGIRLRRGIEGTDVEIDISQAPKEVTGDSGGFYRSGGVTIQVEKKEVKTAVGGTPSTTWVGYKHSNSDGQAFTLKKITHSDVTMKSTNGQPQLGDNMKKEIRQGGAVYVYYKDGDTTKPKVICISEGPPSDTSKNKWYTAGGDQNSWSEDTNTFANKNPSDPSGQNAVTAADLEAASAQPITITPGNDYVIKLDKRPEEATSAKAIKYRTKDKYVEVEKIEYEAAGNSKVPQGYISYKHTTSINGTIIFKHNGVIVNGLSYSGSAEAIYVYYRGSGQDDDHKFPLIVCVKKDAQTRTYYTRGFSWSEDPSLKDVDPDPSTGSVDSKLGNKLEALKDIYEIDIKEVQSGSSPKTYKASAAGDDIRVEKKDKTNDGVPQGYKRFEHKLQGGSFKLGFVIHNDLLLNGIPETVGVQALYVYYKTDDTGHEFPLIVCIKISSTVRTYYTRGFSWSVESKLSTVDPDDQNAGSQEGPLKNELDRLKVKYEIRIEHTNTQSGNDTYKASADGSKIQVAQETTPSNGVPTGYKRYKHSLQTGGSQFKLGFVMHNDVLLSGIPFTENVSAVYVYYKTDDTGHEFPLIVCVKKSSGSPAQTYYTRGQTWNDAGSALNKIDPDSNTAGQSGQPLANKLNELKDIHEILLDNTGSGYKSNAGGTDITVAKQDSDGNKVPQGYVAYTHSGSVSGTVKYKHNGKELKGLPDKSVDINTKNLWVYYEFNSATGHPKLDNPLLIYIYENSSDTWYHTSKKWEETSAVRGDPNDNSSTDIGTQAKHLIEVILKREGTFKELLCFDNPYHWSPILMLTFSLGTIYAFYPMISPYSLIDPERAEKIDLWIVVICALPNLGLAIIDLELPKIGPVGPGKRWIDFKQDYNSWDTPHDQIKVNRTLYHYMWLIGGVPYLICLYVFFSTLHFPEGFIGRHVKDNPYVVGFFGVVFNTVQEFMESTAFGGGAKQSNVGFVGSINQFSVLLMLITCVFTMFSCDGKYLRAPAFISIGDVGGGKRSITQQLEFIPESKKKQRLEEILATCEPPIIIFTNLKKVADVIAKTIIKMNYRAVSLHGGKTQESREEAMSSFKSGDYDILVATDVAGRGVDVEGVKYVINFDMPKDIQTYTHRIGRTGRAGLKGNAISFVTEEDSGIFYDLKQLLLSTDNIVPLELSQHPASKVKPGSTSTTTTSSNKT